MTPEERAEKAYLGCVHDEYGGVCNACFAAAIREAVEAEREECAGHIENVFCDGSAPELLTDCYRAVAKSLRGRCSREQRPTAD